MLSQDHNCGLPPWIIGSTDAAVLAQYTPAQSVVCRRSLHPDFDQAAMKKAVTHLAHDNRLCGSSTLSILDGFNPVVRIQSNGIFIEPRFAEGVDALRKAAIKNLLCPSKTGGAARLTHLLGLPENSWLIADLERELRFATPLVFSGSDFEIVMCTRTVRRTLLHLDKVLTWNYGPRTTMVAPMNNSRLISGDRQDNTARYVANPEDIIDLEPGDMAVLADPHGTPTTSDTGPLEDRLMIGVQPTTSKCNRLEYV